MLHFAVSADPVVALPLHQLSAPIVSEWDAFPSPATPHPVPGIFDRSFSSLPSANNAVAAAAVIAARQAKTAQGTSNNFSSSIVVSARSSPCDGLEGPGDDSGLDVLDSNVTFDAIFDLMQAPVQSKITTTVIAAADVSSPTATVSTATIFADATKNTSSTPPAVVPSPSIAMATQQRSPFALPTPPTGSHTATTASDQVLHLDASALQMLGGDSAEHIFGNAASTSLGGHSKTSFDSNSSSSCDHSAANASPVPLGLNVDITSAAANPFGSYPPSSACSSAYGEYSEYDSSAYGSGSRSEHFASPDVASSSSATSAWPQSQKKSDSKRGGVPRIRKQSARAAAAAATSRLAAQVQEEEEDDDDYEAQHNHRGRRQRQRRMPAMQSPQSSPCYGRGGGGSGDALSDAGASPSPLPEYTGPIPDSYWDLTESMIAGISYRNFTSIVEKSKLTSKQISEAKKVRRRVKNRHSARLCSTRRRDRCEDTETTNQELKDQLSQALADNTLLITQIGSLEEMVESRRQGEVEALREKMVIQTELNRVKAMLQVASGYQNGNKTA